VNALAQTAAIASLAAEAELQERVDLAVKERMRPSSGSAWMRSSSVQQRSPLQLVRSVRRRSPTMDTATGDCIEQTSGEKNHGEQRPVSQSV